MSDPDNGATQFLFSYGTLQDEAVQLATFGRELAGEPDALSGYRLTFIPIEDERFKTHGETHHRNLQFTGKDEEVVEGSVLKLTERELEDADKYEPAYYRRVLVRLRSGLNAWVYLSSPA
jgi:gamma-glutamylcyclotransferase (GGCT)/AIG2-like uncharacterized protein YtfP